MRACAPNGMSAPQRHALPTGVGRRSERCVRRRQQRGRHRRVREQGGSPRRYRQLYPWLLQSRAPASARGCLSPNDDANKKLKHAA
ncbi:hypothetical protein ACFOPN_08180 [Xanthomonas hyacinthi]|uniref:hypothetical protein n=1 Tax=Xanthomonas hyacinthi TaxID=56455 RepID=UPI000AEB433E